MSTQPDFELIRVSVSSVGCFGVLLCSGIPFAVTLERSFSDGPKIPDGLWTCQQTTFLSGGYDTYEVMNVPGHSRLLIHRGNLPNDSDGCILLGRAFGLIQDSPAILNSLDAFTEFIRLVAGKPQFQLLIRTA